MARIFLYRLTRLNIEQDSLVVLQIHEEVPRISAYAHRGSSRVKRQVIHMLLSGEIVKVKGALLIHGDQPALVTREGKVLGPVCIRPSMEAIPAQIPHLDGLVLVQGSRDEGLAVGSPDTAAYRLIERAENSQALAGLNLVVSIRLLTA